MATRWRCPLVVTTAHGTALNRRPFNENTWRPALAEADVANERGNGMHALRHFYASVLLDAGESVKAVGIPRARRRRLHAAGLHAPDA
jgi:site-specific recombinase XerD